MLVFDSCQKLGLSIADFNVKVDHMAFGYVFKKKKIVRFTTFDLFSCMIAVKKCPETTMISLDSIVMF